MDFDSIGARLMLVLSPWRVYFSMIQLDGVQMTCCSLVMLSPL